MNKLIKKQEMKNGERSKKNEQINKVDDEKSVFFSKKQSEKIKRKAEAGERMAEVREEFEQRVVDIARVTRVMAGGKRMRFRACVAIGDKHGKIGVGIAKGADVTLAVTKAVNKAKKSIIDVPIINGTIPHAIRHKMGAAVILLKPARRGGGVIAGGAARIIFELAGINNITSKILGTNNKINVAKCAIEALKNLKKVEAKLAPASNKKEDRKEEISAKNN